MQDGSDEPIIEQMRKIQRRRIKTLERQIKSKKPVKCTRCKKGKVVNMFRKRNKKETKAFTFDENNIVIPNKKFWVSTYRKCNYCDGKGFLSKQKLKKLLDEVR